MAVEWHNESSDTTTVVNLLEKARVQKLTTPSARTAFFARQFLDKPYVAHTLEGATEVLRVNLDELDCTTIVDVSLALAYTLGENRAGWQDFIYNLERMRYRKGKIGGYASRLHYNSDWAVDNIHRGNLEDVTRSLPKCTYMVRSIDFMSAHRDNYPALADSATFEEIKRVEDGLRNHRFPYIKTIDAGSREVLDKLREGDVLGFVSNLKDLDITHMGILVKGADDKLHVLHASLSAGKVVISEKPLPEFLRRNRQWIGIRVYRLRES